MNTSKKLLARLRNKLSKKRVLIIVFVVLIVFFARKLIQSPESQKFETYIVKRDNIQQTLSASGTVKAAQMAELVAQQPGTIEEIYVKDGQWVTSGQLLAKLDSDALYQAYLAAEADFRRTQATLDRVYDEIKGHEDDEDFLTREKRTAAETAKDSAYRALNIARINLSKANFRAPFSGVVTISDTSIGDTAGPTVPVITVTNPETVYFETRVDETEIHLINKDMHVNIELDAFENEVLSQTVLSVSFTNLFTTAGGTVYPVRVSMPPNEALKYKVGLNGSAEFVLNTINDVIVIPDTAVLTDDQNKEFVWIVTSDFTLEKRLIETGTEGSEMIEVISGLDEGEDIVAEPVNEMTEGMKIQT